MVRPGGTILDPRQISRGDWNSIVKGTPIPRGAWGETLELIAALELASLDQARALERAMKQKKNPRLALFLLEQRKQQLTG